MFQFGVKDNIAEVAKSFDRTMGKQIPFATSLAINRIAAIARNRLAITLRTVFDRPTPFTMNSLYTKNSTKTNLRAEVGHKDYAPKGVSASDYLRPNIQGGPRHMKRSEKIFGYYWTPSKFMPLDAYGNVSGPSMVRIISVLKAFGEQGYRANITDKTRARKLKQGKLYDYFFMPPGNPRGLKPGVYLRTAQGRELPMLFFTNKAPVYHVRYEFEKIVQDTIRDRLDGEFASAMDYALSTAKIKIPPS